MAHSHCILCLIASFDTQPIDGPSTEMKGVSGWLRTPNASIKAPKASYI